MWINQELLGEAYPLAVPPAMWSQQENWPLESNHACPSRNSWLNGPIHGPSHTFQLSFSPEIYGRISIYAAVGGKPWNGCGGWKIPFFLQIYGKQILQFSSFMMLNIAGNRSYFKNLKPTLIFFHKEGIAKTQETGKSATIIEYWYKSQFFLVRPKNHPC